ncbi:MAG: hypothetical protein ACI3XZ_09805, partial [Butyricicoccus sp.]
HLFFRVKRRSLRRQSHFGAKNRPHKPAVRAIFHTDKTSNICKNHNEDEEEDRRKNPRKEMVKTAIVLRRRRIASSAAGTFLLCLIKRLLVMDISVNPFSIKAVIVLFHDQSPAALISTNQTIYDQ